MKIKSNTIFCFEVEIYNWFVYVSYLSDDKRFNDFFTKYFECIPERNNAVATVFVNNGVAILDIRKYANDSYLMDTVSHESFHITHEIMMAAGIPLVLETGEAYAYLTGYITKRIYEGLESATKENRRSTKTNSKSRIRKAS